MSTILKALKKLEDEKRANESSHDLPGKILADSPVSRRRSKPVLWVGAGLAAGLILAALVAMGYLGWQELPAVALSTKAPQPVALTTAPMVPKNPADPVRTGKEAAPSPVAHQEGASASVRPATVRIESPGPISPPPVPSRVADKGEGSAAVDVQVPSGTAVKQEDLERHDIPAPGRQWAAPHLVVSDILPATGGERMAIVNGLPVMAGTMVENAVVREIHPDRVVFDISGKSVVVPLTSSR
jgi:hypothetical protein